MQWNWKKTDEELFRNIPKKGQKPNVPDEEVKNTFGFWYELAIRQIKESVIKINQEFNEEMAGLEEFQKENGVYLEGGSSTVEYTGKDFVRGIDKVIRQWYEQTRGYIGVFPSLESRYMWTIVKSTEKWEGRRGEKAKVTQERTVTGTEDVNMSYKAEAISYHRHDGDNLLQTCGYIDKVLKERKAASLQLCRVLIKVPFCLLLSLLTLNEVYVQMPDLADAFSLISPDFLGKRSYLGFLFAQADGLSGRLLHAAIGAGVLALFSWIALPVSRKKGSTEAGRGFQIAGILLALIFGIRQFCQGGESTIMAAGYALGSYISAVGFTLLPLFSLEVAVESLKRYFAAVRVSTKREIRRQINGFKKYCDELYRDTRLHCLWYEFFGAGIPGYLTNMEEKIATACRKMDELHLEKYE
ncbi:MAG TPA: hypothetical protein DF613_10605 [Lachnospiraceae bacterium]|nr:hypothetical protein [Lachnospiraceae bacterium]